MPTVDESAALLLAYLYKLPRTGPPADYTMEGPEIAKGTGLSAHDINDAVALLRHSGLLEVTDFIGAPDYDFGMVAISALGRHHVEKRSPKAAPKDSAPSATSPLRTTFPIGSPYGFESEHWELVESRRGDPLTLHVVLGYQFTSIKYDSGRLRTNVQASFAKALQAYHQLRGARKASLSFRSLAAGYGGHLFNEIAADIISADIAVFDMSDLNPNVMLEAGVALTWGVRVLFIKEASCVKPPSDVSGHTWVDYQDSAATFPDSDHHDKLVRMIQVALGRKLRSQ